MTLPRALLLILVVFLVTPTPLYAAERGSCNRPGSNCPEGTFWIHDEPLGLDARSDLAQDALVINGRYASSLSGCGRTPVQMRSSRSGYDVSATWTDCPGRRQVKIEGVIDAATGGTFVGIIKGVTKIPKPLVATQVVGEAIRLGTYNAKFLRSEFPVNYEKNPPDAAVKISARILASRYDFIALQEIWDEDAKSDDDPYKGFVEMLAPTYPYYVKYAADELINPFEDSGLMIFSRFPFMPLPHNTYKIDSAVCEATDCNRVAFYEFDNCVDVDCLSDKGAAFVRLRHPATSRIYNVVFTHMQAPYYDHTAAEMLSTYATRAAQLGNIKTLLEATLDPWMFQSEEIYVIGDLNIDGDQANTNKGAPDPNNPDTGMFVHNKYEWMVHFANAGSFFTDVLTDSWVADTSPDDRGLSAPRNYEPHFSPYEGRLDYVLRNASSRLCTQHITLAHNLRWGDPYVESGLGQSGTEAGATEMSDHIGLTADINLPAPYCNAASPRAMSVPTGPAVTTPGEIQYPGSMQWYLFTEPGTYGFAVEGAPVAYHVYESTDLSMPMANYKKLSKTVMSARGHQHEVQMFLVPEAPFYVRVFVPDYSGWTGNYQLVAKRFDCTSKEEACLLAPAQTSEHIFPANTVIGANDTMWFEFHTEATGWDRPGSPRVDTGGAQRLGIEVDRLSSQPGGLLQTALLRSDGVTVLEIDTIHEADVEEPDYGSNPTSRLLILREEPGPETRYITVARNNPAVAAPLRVQWRTNLTVLHGSQVGVPGATPFDFSVADHGDLVGDEEFYFWLIADGDVVVNQAHLGDFSLPSNLSLEPHVTAVRYVDSVHAIWVEVDNAYDGGYNNIDDDDVVEAVIETLAPEAECKTAEHRNMVDDEGYGAYTFSFNRCHGLPVP